MKNLILVFTILLVGGLWSCNPSHNRLCEIDEIMESEPERALRELEQLDRSNMSHDDSAYFALLYTQAQVKCKVMDLSDTLINIAYKAYAHTGNIDLKKRCYFYKAQIAFDKGELKPAMKDVIVAYDIAKEENDPYWIAKSAELMGDIYFDAYNYWEAEKYTAEAANNYLSANKILNHRYALSDLGTVFLNENRYPEATALLDSLLQIVDTEDPNDSTLIDYINIARSFALFSTQKYDDLKNKDLPIHTTQGRTEKEIIDYSLINSFILNEDADYIGSSLLISKAYGLSTDERERIKVLYASFRHSIASKDYEKATFLADTVLMMQTKIAEDVLRESVAGEQRDFYSAKAEYQQRRSELMMYILVGVIIVAMIITALLIGMYRLKMRAKKAELEANLSELMRVREQAELIDSEYRDVAAKLSEKSTEMESLQKRIESNIHTQKQNSEIIEHLFHEKWQTLNMLCNDYFDLGSSEKTRIAILYNIRQELEKQRSPQNMKEIEEAVNRYMGNLMNMLREECPLLKEQDYTFLSLVFAGMSVRAVCLLLDIKYKLFYLKKSRLSKRIATSDAPHKDIFLRKMGATV